MDSFDYGDPLDREPVQHRPRQTNEDIGDFHLWQDTVHRTGFMEDQIYSIVPAHAPLEAEDDIESPISSDEDVGEHGAESDAEDDDFENDPQTVAMVDKAMTNLTLADDAILKQAYALFVQGRQTAQHDISNPQALLVTPEEFSSKGIEFMSHQLSEAGRQETIMTARNTVHSADDATNFLRTLAGSIVAFEMGLGKTFIAIGVINACIRSGTTKPILIVIPLQLLTQWKEDLDKYLSTDYLLYRPAYEHAPDYVESHRVILTTYDNVRREHQAYLPVASVRDEKQVGNFKGPLPVRGSYPLMVLRFAVIIADEIGKASRSQSQTSAAMCAVQAEKRLGMTGTPLENDYDEIQTLIRWLRIEPWDDAEVFNQYFVAKKKKKRTAKTLKGIRNAILSTSLRAFVYPLGIDDTFNNQPLVQFKRARRTKVNVSLTDDEFEYQELTRYIWDKGAECNEFLPIGRLLSEILRARMKVVHTMCGNDTYGEQGLGGDELAQDEDGNLVLAEDLIGSLAEEGVDEVVKEDPAAETAVTPEEHDSRAALLAATKNNWQSSRINKLVDLLKPLVEKEGGGKILVFDEFLQTLDVISNALRANDIDFLEFNGHKSLDERDIARRRFQNPNDPVKVMLITIQCGGLGLNLTEASDVFMMTPRWNPFFDDQAIARANRKGQTRLVTVYEFYSSDSIERHVLKLRKKKVKKENLLLRKGGVQTGLRNRMSEWSEEDFRRNLVKLKVEESVKKKEEALKSKEASKEKGNAAA